MGDHENVFPSRASAKLYKVRIANAQKGLSVMKRKRDALEVHLRYLQQRIKDIIGDIIPLMTNGLLELSRAKFYGAHLESLLVAPSYYASTYCKLGTTKIIGYTTQNFTLDTSPNQDIELVGLGAGGGEIKKARHTFTDILERVIFIGSIEQAIYTLELAIRDTNMRVNAIEYIIIPKLERTLLYINNELEERDREDFFRIKRSKQKSTRDAEKKKEKKSEEIVPPMIMCSCPPRRRVRKRHNVHPIDEAAQTDPFYMQ